MVAREQWPSRTSFILASMGSAIGLGNLLRYPSVVWANWGLQWFIPYIFALFSIGIPLLLLEIALGQTFKSTNVVGFGRINHRLRGLGLGSIVNAYIVATYYNIIISWCIIYLVRSFESPLPWIENPSRFLTDEIIANVGSTWMESKGNIIWNTWIWSALIWICIFFSLFKGVNLLGKIVYVTLGIPFLMLIVLVTRGITLENASRGIHYYVGVWRLEVLGEPSIWQDAVGQIFFSIGAGFGVFTTYASYNPIFQDSVVDALIIGLSNSAFEVIAAFSTFGVVGFLDLVPGKDTLGTFILGFITYPTALAQMEFANLSSVLFFVMLFFLGIDSSFSLVEPIITLFEDSKVIGARFKRSTICIWFTIFGILCAFIYSLDVGAAFLNYVDRYTNNFALPFVAFAQCFSCGYLYRYKDVAKEIGYRSYLLTIIAYLGAVIAALLCANASLTNPIAAGVSGGLIFFAATLMVTLFSAKLPETNPYKLSSCWNKLYWVTMYQPDQLRKDLNTVVACHGRTSIPFMWALIIKFVTGPVTLIMCSFSLVGIVELVTDPIAAFGVFTGMLIVLFTIVGIIVPRFLNPLIPLGEEKGWKDQYNNLPGKCFTKETNDQSNETVSERV